MLVLLDDSLLALIDIHTLPGGLALQLAAAEVEPALGAVEVDGVNHRSNASSASAVNVTPFSCSSSLPSFTTIK